jgi:folate-dependent tRNA-U54 methylase TrmFO/GidA
MLAERAVHGSSWKAVKGRREEYSAELTAFIGFKTDLKWTSAVEREFLGFARTDGVSFVSTASRDKRTDERDC